MTCKLSGSNLLVEKPFAYALKSDMISEICDYCFQKGTLRKCSGCQTLFYCSRDCQKQGWKVHKKECPLLLRIRPLVLPDAAFFISRIILSLKRNPNEKGFYSNTEFRTFDDLQSHEEELRRDETRLEHLSVISVILGKYLGEENFPNFDELLHLYGKVCINSFSILNKDLKCVGSGIYLAGSMFDHSCKPNAVTVFKGTTLYVIATEDIPNFEWSKVRISYEDLLSLTSKRREELRRCYYFDCSCPRCLDESLTNLETAMLCQNSKCGGPVYINNQEASKFSCKNCSRSLTKDKVTEFKALISSIEEQFSSGLSVQDDSKNGSDWFLKISKHAHPHNYYYVRLLDLAFETAIAKENWADATKYGPLLAEGLRKYCGDHNPILGIHFMKLSKIHVYLSNKKMAVQCLQEALQVLKPTASSNIFNFSSDFAEQ